MKQRRVKPQVTDDYELDEEYDHASDREVLDNGASDDEFPEEDYTQHPAEYSEEEDDGEEVDEEGGDEDMNMEDDGPEEDAAAALKNISFGTLSRAQASISKDRRKPETAIPKLDAKGHEQPPPSNARAALEARRAAARAAAAEEKKRTSKNAPQEVTSKRAVTRRRTVIEPIHDPSKLVRDPRFDSAVKGHFNEQHFRKNYAFLDKYREDEMKMLKAELKKARDPEEKERIEKKLKSMKSQKETQENKDKVAEVLREHKKQEKEKVKQGKKAYYLKPSEVKRKVLEKQYEKLSEKQLEKVMARKQKRKAQKEKKNMPWARRGAE